MASPYLALMQSGALRRSLNVPMFGGPTAAEAVNPVADQARIADMTRGLADETRPMGPPNFGRAAGALRGLFGRRRPPIGRGMPGGNMTPGGETGFVPPRGGFLGRPLPVDGGMTGGNMGNPNIDTAAGVAPPITRAIPPPQALAPVPQPTGRLQRRMGSFGGGRGFLTNQGVY